MSFLVRDGKLDVAVVAGPRVSHWPSAGVLSLSSLCAQMGLRAGLFGGDTMTVRGVIPLPGTGGLALIEDAQRRIHRIHARAIVKVSAMPELPDPFPGWRSPGLMPLSTALRLRREGGGEGHLQWDPCTVVLGTGNPALRFGSGLLEGGVPQVYCVETYTGWGAKRFAGWEVERRRFESAGGRLIEARPVSLTSKAALLWELRLQDAQGVRVLEAARVVSAGPFRDLPGVREHPPGSFLFEFEQTARETKVEDVEGWIIEEERGRWLAGKIVRALVTDLGPDKERLESIFRRAKVRLRRYARHREEPFTPAYQGKWVSSGDARKIRSFRGVPQKEHHKRLVASIECFEEIPCNLCQTACPEGAIDIGQVPRKESILFESKCTACGLCLTACPSSATLLLTEREDRSISAVTLSWRGSRPWAQGEFAQLLNRRGEMLGSVRVLEAGHPLGGVQLVQVEVPTHLVWEGRSLRRGRSNSAEDDAYLRAAARSAAAGQRVEITLDGERRLVRDKVPASVALFETGRSRPEDALLCPDGSCGLCQIFVDGVRKLACQTRIHRGMAIRLISPQGPAAAAKTGASGAPAESDSSLCPCLGVTSEHVVERLKQGKLQSPEAVIAATHVGEGKCHGQVCMEPFRRLCLDQGIDAEQWVDWRFPWMDWVLARQ